MSKTRIRNTLFHLMAMIVTLSFLMTVASAQDGTPASPDDITKGNVTLNPGYVQGNVSIGDVSKNTLSVKSAAIKASAKDAAGNDLYAQISLGSALGNYDLTLHVPDEVRKLSQPQEYDVSCVVYYNRDSSFLRLENQKADVSYQQTVSLNFELNPGYVTGDVTVGCKTLSWGRIYVWEASSSRNSSYTRIYIGADGQFYFPIRPGIDCRIGGTVYMTDGWVYELEERDINVPVGTEFATNWNLLPEPCGPSCHGSISGKVELTGAGDNTLHHHWVQVDGATYRKQDIYTDDYAFEGLQCGKHKFWAYSYLNSYVHTNGKTHYDDYFRHPFANYQYPVDTEGGLDVVNNVSTKAAFVNGQITMGPRTVVTIPEDAYWDTYIHGHGVSGSATNGWSRDQVDISNGTYDLILSEAQWNVYYTSLHFKNAECELCDGENPRYLDSYVYIEDFTRFGSHKAFDATKGIPSLNAGQSLSSHNLSYETGSVTFKYYVNGGGTLKEPYLTGANDDQTEARIKIEAHGLPDETSEGEVTFVAPPGRYTIIPRATAADGTDVTFGEQVVYVVAGACRVFEPGAPTISIESPTSYSACSDAAGQQITVAGTVTDENGVASVLVNGSPVAFEITGNPDPEKPNEVSFTTTVLLDLGANPVEVTATNLFQKTASDVRTVQVYEAGVFTVGETGTIEVDWLYDGGAYKGELGVFSLSGMGELVPNSPEFIKEAARRVLSNSEDGFVAISDQTEAAKFSGSLGEAADWNSGEYAEVKTFQMRPGDKFATMLVPNSTVQEVYNNPETGNAYQRPLFSLASANPAYGMYAGQLADINGAGNAFIYEDMSFSNSDRDFNDFIFQIFGSSVCLPLLDDLINPDKDWRKFDGGPGYEILEHIEPDPGPESLWMSVTLEGYAHLLIYDSEGRECGKDGNYIPEAGFDTDENGNQVISVLGLESGDYRVILRGTDDESLACTVRGYQGEDILWEETKTAEIESHQVLRAAVSVSLSDDGLEITFGEPEALPDYDFDGNGKIDDADIEQVSSRWNAQAGDESYDPFYDLDDDGYIGILDIMPVVNSKSVH